MPMIMTRGYAFSRPVRWDDERCVIAYRILGCRCDGDTYKPCEDHLSVLSTTLFPISS